jgi:hypothetical protein
MPAIVIVLMFLVLFLVAFLAVLVAPLIGMGFTIWKQGKTSTGAEAATASAPEICK